MSPKPTPVMLLSPQYHISKVSQTEPMMQSSSAAMDDLDSALQCLEVKMEGTSSSASEMLVRHFGSAVMESDTIPGGI